MATPHKSPDVVDEAHEQAPEAVLRPDAAPPIAQEDGTVDPLLGSIGDTSSAIDTDVALEEVVAREVVGEPIAGSLDDVDAAPQAGDSGREADTLGAVSDVSPSPSLAEASITQGPGAVQAPTSSPPHPATEPWRPAPPVMARVLCITNQKGGVGKTTTTVSLGAALAGEGLKVLVVDLDPQGNATTGLGLRVGEGQPSTYRVVVEQMAAEDAIEPTSVPGLDVLPSSLDLAGAEIELVPQFSREGRLKRALAGVADRYHVVLIDCPPSLGLLTINAMVAADELLVPIQCEYYALEGLGQLIRTVDLVAAGLNEGLEIGGVLMTMFDARTNLSQQVVDEVRAHFGDTAFDTVIPRTVRLSEAPSFGQPITVFDPSSKGARAYQRLAVEVGTRLGLLQAVDGATALDRLLGVARVVETTPSPDDDRSGSAAEQPEHLTTADNGVSDPNPRGSESPQS